jgi:hypothetical protein
MAGHAALEPASLGSTKRVVNEPEVLGVGRREVPHVVAVEQPFPSRPVAEVAPEFLPPAETILREMGLAVEDPGGRESEAVRFGRCERCVAADGCQIGAIGAAIVARSDKHGSRATPPERGSTEWALEQASRTTLR